MGCGNNKPPKQEPILANDKQVKEAVNQANGADLIQQKVELIKRSYNQQAVSKF